MVVRSHVVSCATCGVELHASRQNVPGVLSSVGSTRLASPGRNRLRVEGKDGLRLTSYVCLTKNSRLVSSVPSAKGSTFLARAQASEDVETVPPPVTLGEDAAYFDPEQQSRQKWIFFSAELAVVLAILYAVWMAPGQGLADDFVGAFEGALNNSHLVMIGIFTFFAIVHSGMAYLRPYGEELIGARAYRVIFAAISLPLAVAAVVYFINHRYDGIPLWNFRRVPGMHEFVWGLNFISFFFLYPSTFNLLEVAAVDKPKLHLWETGVMRITRHPQAFGQGLWCLGHTLWIGSSFMVLTSALLMAHHVFACWHGDFRLRRQYGSAFDAVKERTSTIPFLAILDGRQQLPPDYWKEWARLPYLTILAVTLGAYWAHPLIQQGSAYLGW